MIITVDALNRSDHQALLREMHRLRARTFADRLGWDVVVENGEERDHFDELDPAYLVAIDDDGQVVGCMRALQTTGPNMLADVFHMLLDGEPAPRSARLWEASRFCIDTQRLADRRGPRSIGHVTSEMLIAAFEASMAAGVRDVVAVIDPVMHRILKLSGNAPYDVIGTPKQVGKVVALAVLFDCTQERIDSIRARSGIDYDVFSGLRRPHLLEIAA